MQKYSAKINIVNGNPYVEVPQKVLETIFKAFGKDKGQIPVRGKIDGADFTQTLVRYEGDWKLYVNMIMMKAAGIEFKMREMPKLVGKEVTIEVEYDPVSRELPLNKDLKKALDKDSKAKNAYDELAPYRKHEINRYLSFLKTQEKTDLNIFRILQHLRGEESDALYPLMHRKKPK